MYHKMQKMVGTYKFSTWEQAKHELYPSFMAITLVPMGPKWAPSTLKDPWWAMNCPTLKGVIHCYILHIMLSSPRTPSNYEEKTMKGKRHMKKGGKTKAKVTHVPRFAPPTLIYPSAGFPHHSYPCTITCGLEHSPNSHSVSSLYHMPHTHW